jgi:hypothetical protein
LKADQAEVEELETQIMSLIKTGKTTEDINKNAAKLLKKGLIEEK